MAKKRVKNKQKRSKRKRGQAVGRTNIPLTEAEAQYATLLADPCSAPLVHGLWPGSNGAVLQRFETDFIPSALNGAGDATTTSWACLYVPGSNYLFFLTTVAGTAAVQDTTPGVFKRSGGNECAPAQFVNFGHTRAVAACMQLYFPGAENTRSGVVSMGVVPASAAYKAIWQADGGFTSTDVVTAAQLRSNCVLTERMPQNKLEIKWFPGAGDAFSFNYQQKMANAGTALPDALQGRNALLVVASGFPAGVYPRVRIVNAVEWTGSASLMTGSVIASVPEARRGTIDHVLTFLSGHDSSWYLRQAGEAVVAALSSTLIRYASRRAPHTARIEM